MPCLCAAQRRGRKENQPKQFFYAQSSERYRRPVSAASFQHQLCSAPAFDRRSGRMLDLHPQEPPWGGFVRVYLHIYLHPLPRPAENRSERLTYSIRTRVLSHFSVLWFSFTSSFLYLSVETVSSARETHSVRQIKAAAFQQVSFLNFFPTKWKTWISRSV